MATKKKTPASDSETQSGAPDSIAQMPPPGEENKTPEQLAAENKSESVKALDQAVDARIATGGQSGVGSTVPGAQGVGSADGKTVTTNELKISTHPLAPSHPLEVPDKPKE